MQLSHIEAERKYKNLRSIAYEITMDELPYQDKKAILLTEIDAKAIRGIMSAPRRGVEWDWNFGVQSYRRRYPNRLELAIWYRNTICGLSVGRPSYNGTRVRLDFIERVPMENNPLKGRVTPIAVTAYEVYARLIDAVQVRIMSPAEELVAYYTSLNYEFIKGTGASSNPSYLYKNLEG